MLTLKAWRGTITCETVVRHDQRNGRTITLLWLAGNIADRFVQQDGHARNVLSAFIERNALRRINPRAQLVHAHAIDVYPSALDVFIGFPARTQSAFRHELGHSNFFSDAVRISGVRNNRFDWRRGPACCSRSDAFGRRRHAWSRAPGAR